METRTAAKKIHKNFLARIETNDSQANGRAFKEPRRVRFDVEFFYKLMELGLLPEDASTEIIDGELIDRMGTGSKHAGIVKKINRFLSQDIGESAIVSIQDPVHLNKYNEPLPDVALLKSRADFYSESHPTPDDVLLLIEVSDTTVKYDKETKMSLYAEAGIKEFWLINLPEKMVEVYSEPKSGFYGLRQTYGATETVCGATVDVSLPAAEIFGAAAEKNAASRTKAKNTKEKK